MRMFHQRKFYPAVLILATIITGGLLLYYYVYSRHLDQASHPAPWINALVSPNVSAAASLAITPFPSTGWKTYRSERYWFEIRYPYDFTIDRNEINRLKLMPDEFRISNPEHNCQIWMGTNVIATTKTPYKWHVESKQQGINDQIFQFSYVYDDLHNLVAITAVPNNARQINSFSVDNFDATAKNYDLLNTACVMVFTQTLSTFKTLK